MIRALFTVGLFMSALAAGGNTARASASDITDACVIFEERSDWQDAAKAAAKKWQVSVPAILAFIHRESRFKADAASKVSTAYGFAQALDGTWAQYKKSTKDHTVDRANFADSADFIGWYMTLTKDRLGIPLHNVSAHYIAYHEGHGGYKSNRWTEKPALIRVTQKVTQMAATYEGQLLACGILDDTPAELMASRTPVQKPFGLEKVVAKLPRRKPINRYVASVDTTLQLSFHRMRWQ